MGAVQTQILTPTPTPPWEVQSVNEVRTTFGLNLAPKAPEVSGGGGVYGGLTSPSVCMLKMLRIL